MKVVHYVNNESFTQRRGFLVIQTMHYVQTDVSKLFIQSEQP